MALAESERNAYLARLGLEAEPPSVDALFRLHRAHAERIPYETLWIHTGERWSVDAGAAVRRIAFESRGGYCFHLNGAFSELLGDLGYDVVRHVGGVHGPAGRNAEMFGSHLVLSVRGLPATENPGGVWYLDVGLGDALHEPLPLVEGTYRQGPWQLALEAADDELGDWHLLHDPDGGFTGMAWHSAPATMAAFAAKNEWLSTSPDSPFVQVLTAQLRDATGVNVLRGLVFKRLGDDGAEEVLSSEAELVAVLGDVFGLDLKAPLPWDKLVAAHEAWTASEQSRA